MVEYGSTPYLLFMLGRICRDHHDVRDGRDHVPRRLAAAIAVVPFTWVPGVIWFTLKVFFMFFLFAMAKAIVPRYRYDHVDAARLEVVPGRCRLAMVVIVAGVLALSLTSRRNEVPL